MTDAVPVPHRFVARVVLIQLGVIQAALGLYALLAPRSFYDDFPLGRGWVEALPAYSEHLVRDIGGLFLGVGFLLIAAAIRLERRWVVISLVSYLLFTVPHTVYHLLNLGAYETGDAIGQAITVLATVLLPLGLLALLAGRAGATAALARPPTTGGGRIEGVPDGAGGILARVGFRQSRRRFGAVMDPMRVYAHNPTVLAGYGAHELAAERTRRVPERLKHLATMRAAMLPGCEWCLDFGSSLSRDAGVSDDDMRDLPVYAQSERFSELEKLVMDYATGISRTPVDVSDELFARLREHFDEAQLVELTDIIALENYRARFNWAFGLAGQGFAEGEGAYCVRPASAHPAAPPAPAA